MSYLIKIGEDCLFVEYYRISTNSSRQALSLPYQKHSIQTFYDRYGGSSIGSFTEEISGQAGLRPEFIEAVELCRQNGAILLVHKLSRLSRNGLTDIAYLEQMEVQYIEAVSPGDSQFIKEIKLIQAKEENRTRKENIRSGIAQIKRNISEKGYHISKSGRKISKLGTPGNLTQAGREKSKITQKTRARTNLNNVRALAVIKLLQEDHTYAQMAIHLNKNGFRTSTGVLFNATAVRNVLKLYDKLPVKLKAV